LKDPTGGPLDGLPTIRPGDGIQAGKRSGSYFYAEVTEIYGEEGGWDSLAWHGFTTMSIHTRQEI